MGSTNTNTYVDLVTSQHSQKPKFKESLSVAISPIVDCQNMLSQLSEFHDLETASGKCVENLAYWTGTLVIIPGATQLEFFGFIDQENSLTFGETDDPDIGGYFRESGQSGTGGLTPKGELLRRLIRAKILKNQSLADFLLSHLKLLFFRSPLKKLLKIAFGCPDFHPLATPLKILFARCIFCQTLQ